MRPKDLIAMIKKSINDWIDDRATTGRAGHEASRSTLDLAADLIPAR